MWNKVLRNYLRILPFFAKLNSAIPKISPFAIINSAFHFLCPKTPRENDQIMTHSQKFAKFKVFGVSFAKINSALIYSRINLFP